VTDRLRLAIAVTATVATALILLLAVTHFTWDVLQSRDSELFVRVNAMQLESEADGALRDPVAMASVILVNLVIFGVPGILGARLYPRRWWAAAAALASLGGTLWLLRFGLLLVVPGAVSAKLASVVAALSMVGSAVRGAWLGRKRTHRHAHAG
jgi:hypothetical protein